jgi:pimeloyl-ACP methyl ester carboxylesterase
LCDLEMSSASGETIRVNGMEMYYEIRGAGEPLLLLHGGGGAGVNWSLIFKNVPPGHRLIVPDLRGHGRSTNPSGRFTFRQSALDVFGMLDHLGVEKFKAIGMSLGAKTLLHVATQQPTRVEAMVLVSATPYFPKQARAIMRQVSPDNRTEAEWQQMRQWHKHGDEQIRALWRMSNAFKDSYDDMNFTPPYLSTITARTLIVHGDRDPLYPIEMALELYRSIPDSYLWVVPNGGHGPIFGNMADQFVKRSLEFLNGEWSRE